MPIVLDDVFFNKASILERACQAAMVGFRNVAVHAYQNPNRAIVRSIMKKDWIVFVEFARELGLRVDPQKEKT